MTEETTTQQTTLIKPLQIGPHQIVDPVVLAPMAGVTDRPFRQLCKNLGAGLAVSEMVGANSLIYGSEKTKRRANHDGETRPVSVQIVGADPQMLALAAKYNADEGAEIIDINMGCPAKKICNAMAGSSLMRDELLVGKILEAVVGAVSIPVTLKIRTGWDKNLRNGARIAQLAQSCGIQALAVHGRTRACRFEGEAEFDTIAEIKRSVTIPVIANGDITTPEKAKWVLEYTGVDAIMVGRAAQGKPWIFQEIMHYLKTGQKLNARTPDEIKRILMEHLDNLYSFYGNEKGVMIARKHVSWYCKGQNRSAAFRHAFNQVGTVEDQIILIRDYFDKLIDND